MTERVAGCCFIRSYCHTRIRTVQVPLARSRAHRRKKVWGGCAASHGQPQPQAGGDGNGCGCECCQCVTQQTANGNWHATLALRPRRPGGEPTAWGGRLEQEPRWAPGGGQDKVGGHWALRCLSEESRNSTRSLQCRGFWPQVFEDRMSHVVNIPRWPADSLIR